MQLYRILLVLFSLFFGVALAQESPFLFINPNEDIGRRAVTSMVKDSTNQLWIGTYGGGLKKYDGVSVESFKHNVSNAAALSSSVVYGLLIDNNETLWIATNNGLNQYINDREKFKTYNPKNKNLSIHALAILDDTSIIVGTHQDGLYIFNTATKIFRKVALPTSMNENGLQINALAVDLLKRVWVASNLGLFQLDTSLMKLENIEGRDTQKNHLSNQILSLKLDSYGNLWCGTVKNGVLKVLTRENNNLKVNHYPVTNKRIFAIEEYTSGTMLFGSENDGLFVLSNEGNLLNRYIKENGNPYGIESNSIWSIFCDDKNRVWIGYYNHGVDKYDPNYFKFEFLQNNIHLDEKPFPTSISSIAKDNKGRIWFSCIQKGVFVHDIEKNEYTHLNNPKNPIASGLNSLDIPSIYIDSKQNIWIASWYNGIYVLKNGSKKFKNFSSQTHPSIIKSNRIVSFSEDSNGVIWIGTFLGGLLSYDLKTEKFEHYASQEFQNFELNNSNIRKVIVDKQNIVWLGTRKGIYSYNPASKKINSLNARIHEISNNTINDVIVFSLYEDSNNNIWIGTDGYGLFSYNIIRDKLTWHAESQELKNTSVNSITQTFDGAYWLGTDNGLIRYDFDQENFLFFDSTDGLLNKRINRNAFYTEGNTLYLGTSEGINYFNFDDISKNNTPPKIVIKNLKIGNKRVAIDAEGPLQKILQYSDTIYLNHDQSSFTIDYIGVNQTRGENNNYAYMLEGLDSDWNYVNQMRTATFTNIKPGKYTFKLKAANNDGIWTENAKSIFIQVLPPWWATLGAKIAYIFIFFALGFYILRLIRLRILERRKVEIERNQRHQTEELNAKKIQFFTNISHEFRTPLTLILNPLESLLSSQDTTLSDDVKTKHKIIHRNTKRLKRLIDELMDFRKMQFSKIQLRVKESNLIEIIDNVVSYYEEEASYRNISLKVKYDTLINPIWIDPTMLEKIIFNLLSNAFKATHEGGNILVTVGYHENGIIFPLIDSVQLHSAFEITIEDSGVGIKKENVHKIFERFYQDKDNNKQYFGGTGIGLEVVKKFVDYHKGIIQVESQQDVGTSFKIFFAAGNDHFSETEFSSFIEKISFPENKSPKAINDSEEKNVIDSENLEQSILIVEDNMELRQYLKLELKNQYRIFEASNGKIGLYMASKFKPDVIIADVMMPEMDGVQMCSLIKGNPSTSNIPVLMLTAKVAEKERIEGIDSGADVYLKKPFSINLLKSHLRQLIRTKEAFYQTYFKSLDLEVDSIGHDKKILADVINAIGNNLSKEDLCVQDIANELGLSRSKLYRKIKKLTGKSANQIIRSIRLEKSKELLSMTDMTIGEICFKVGFASPSYFTKRFREYTNTIPKEYRQQHKEKKQTVME